MSTTTTANMSQERRTPGTAQATLLDILGDMVHPDDVAVPTAAFLAVMRGMGFSDPAIRQSIARGAGAGWIAKERNGRNTLWRLTPAGRTLVADGIRGVEQLADPYTDWDGRWRVVIITISTEQRSTRDRVYRALRWDGFGNPLPSVWVSPHTDRDHRTRAALRAVGLDRSCISFVAELDDLGLSVADVVGRGWDLPGLEARYRHLLGRFQSLAPNGDAATLTALLQLDAELQQLLVTDPALPRPMTPDQPYRAAAQELLALRRRWHGPAKRYWTAVVAELS